MRQASIQTTLAFYVAQDADDVADELWASHGNALATPNEIGPKEGADKGDLTT